VSLTDWGREAALALHPEIRYVGLKNYHELFTGFLNMRFRQDLANMFFFTLAFVGLSLFVGLFLATLIDQLVWGGGLSSERSFCIRCPFLSWSQVPYGGGYCSPEAE